MKLLRGVSILGLVVAAMAVALLFVDNDDTSSAVREPNLLPDITQRAFTDLGEASAFAGFPLSVPKRDGWTAKNQIVTKIHGLPKGEVVDAEVLFVNSAGDGSFRLTISNQENAPAVAGGKPEAVTLAGIEATLDRGPAVNPAVRVVSWIKNGMSFKAVTLVRENFNEQELLAALESIARD